MNFFKTIIMATLSLIRLVSLLFLILLTFLFSNAQIFNLPYMPYGAVFSDYDLDGDNDIFISCPSSDTIVILHNTGYGNLERIDLPYPTATYIFLCIVNNDDYPDIITGCPDGIIYYSNDSTGGFDENYTVIPRNHEHIRVEEVKDMDNNGYPDILYYAFLSPYGWGIIYNNGDGTFTDDFIHQSEYTEFLNIDFLNNDNRLDILVSSSNMQPGNYIAYNHDTGFALDTLFDHSELWIYNTIIDIDIDGDNDILFNKPSILNYGKFLIYENLSNENFVNKGITNKKTGTRVDIVSDLDGDNYPDIACISGGSGAKRDSIYIFRNTQNWGFELMDKIYIGENKNYNEHLYAGDLNSDGMPELLVTGYMNPTRSHTRLLWNDGTGHFVDSNLVTTTETLIPKLKISARPNPFSKYVVFEINNSNYREILLNIYNLQGHLIYEQKIHENNSVANILWNGQSYDNTECRPGVYIVRLIVGNENYAVVKIIKY
ncbi:MAG: T9SS type A sorting domain-containing protein [Bacteroidales bacterium]|nr:T9SS type A sorting domain-containing protein [Bacteroidales bacterium]